MALITALPWRPLPAAEWRRECAARAAITAQIQAELRNEPQAAAELAAAVVALCSGIRRAADFQIAFDSDTFGADAMSEADWRRGCQDLDASVRGHVQALASASYAAIQEAFFAGLKAR